MDGPILEKIGKFIGADMTHRITISGVNTTFAVLEEPFSIDGRYTLRDRDGHEFKEVRSADGRVLEPFPAPGSALDKRLYLGRGGFGAVVRVVDRIGIPRAVKFLEGAAPSDAVMTGSLEAEVRYANVRPGCGSFGAAGYEAGCAVGLEMGAVVG